jgi:PilZ domain/Uncharacterized ACR, COG1430
MAEIHYIRDATARKVPEDLTHESAPGVESALEANLYCAYNESRQCFVATEVDTADGAGGVAEARLQTMEPGSGTALWIFPFHGISPSCARFPLDLVFLDKDSMVLETVEFFPMNVGGDATANAASVLVLAADSLAQVQVKAGDRLVVVAREQMLHRLPGPKKGVESVAPESPLRAPAKGDTLADPLKSEPRKSLESALRDENGRSAAAHAVTETPEQTKPAAAVNGRLIAVPELPAHPVYQEETAIASRPSDQIEKIPSAEPMRSPIREVMPDAIPVSSVEAVIEEEIPVVSPALREPWKEDEVPRTWLERIVLGDNKDPRRFRRFSPPQLIAYYFTGGPPAAKRVRDISTSGLYIETGERWYLGTIVQLTLTDKLRPKGSQSISLFAKVVRWGSDGVGLTFLLEGLVRRRVERYDVYEPTNGIGVDQVGDFVRQFEAS